MLISRVVQVNLDAVPSGEGFFPTKEPVVVSAYGVEAKFVTIKPIAIVVENMKLIGFSFGEKKLGAGISRVFLKNDREQGEFFQIPAVKNGQTIFTVSRLD